MTECVKKEFLILTSGSIILRNYKSFQESGITVVCDLINRLTKIKF